MGATIPVAFGQTRCNVHIDTGAMKSCMSQTFCQQLMLPTMRSIYTYQVKSATGSNLCPMGITGCEFKIGDKGYKTDFVVCKNLTRPCILGIDFLRKHNIFAGWTAEGKFKLISQEESSPEQVAPRDMRCCHFAGNLHGKPCCRSGVCVCRCHLAQKNCSCPEIRHLWQLT